MNGETPCPACKELLNDDAAYAAKKSHKIALVSAEMHAVGHMSRHNYALTLDELSKADRAYRDAINAIGEEIPARISEPLPNPGEV